eukprot:85311-Heterocapsa_arctica.AAC.1
MINEALTLAGRRYFLQQPSVRGRCKSEATLALENAERQMRQTMIAHARQGSPCGHDHQVPPDPFVLQQSPVVIHARSAAQEPFDLSRDFCRRVILGVLCQWRAQARLQAIRRCTAHSRRDDYREWEVLLAEHMRHAITSHDTAALWKYARILAGKRI